MKIRELVQRLTGRKGADGPSAEEIYAYEESWLGVIDPYAIEETNYAYRNAYPTKADFEEGGEFYTGPLEEDGREHEAGCKPEEWCCCWCDLPF